MPIYEYQCEGCHHQFEVIQKISAEPVKECPQCFENKAVRLVSAPGFQLKGTGWYATDFKDKNKPAIHSESTKASTTEKKESGSKTTESVPSSTVTKGEKD